MRILTQQIPIQTLEVPPDKIEANFKRQCAGAGTNAANPLTNEGHLNHRGALRIKNSTNRSVQKTRS